MILGFIIFGCSFTLRLKVIFSEERRKNTYEGLNSQIGGVKNVNLINFLQKSRKSAVWARNPPEKAVTGTARRRPGGTTSHVAFPTCHVIQTTWLVIARRWHVGMALIISGNGKADFRPARPCPAAGGNAGRRPGTGPAAGRHSRKTRGTERKTDRKA